MDLRCSGTDGIIVIPGYFTYRDNPVFTKQLPAWYVLTKHSSNGFIQEVDIKECEENLNGSIDMI